MTANHYDAAAAWLDHAWHSVQRARDCIRIGTERNRAAGAALRAAYEADKALLRELLEIGEEWSGARVASLVYERIRASGRDVSLQDNRAAWRAFAGLYGRHRG